jgi:hypothetical protein
MISVRERFCKTVAEAEEFDAFQNVGEHYAGIRRWSPAFLSAFVFESVPASASLLRAIEMLRDMNSKDPADSAGLPTSCRVALSTGVITNFVCALGIARPFA